MKAVCTLVTLVLFASGCALESGSEDLGDSSNTITAVAIAEEGVSNTTKGGKDGKASEKPAVLDHEVGSDPQPVPWNIRLDPQPVPWAPGSDNGDGTKNSNSSSGK